MAGRLQLLFPAGVYERPDVSADMSPACVDTTSLARESTLNECEQTLRVVALPAVMDRGERVQQRDLANSI
jgi:hypothetical protein